MSNAPAVMPQLEMVWPTHAAARALSIPNPGPLDLQLAPGYRMRQFDPATDGDAYRRLLQAAGFEDWTDERTQLWLNLALPKGWFVIEAANSGELVATAMAAHRPAVNHPFGGELGWVAAHPEHRGRKLGWTVCAAVVNRLLEAGYDNIYLKTDDFRSPAILTYLRMGYLPYFYVAGMPARWKAVCTALDWPYTPDVWPTTRG